MRVRHVVGGALLGAAAAYLFDPLAGNGRRARLRDQAAAQLKRAQWRGEQLQRHATNVVEGKMQQLTSHEGDRAMDDTTIAQRIRSEVLGRPNLDAREVIVDVEEGVARLRGQLDDTERIESVVEETRKIPGVRDIENLIHLPDTPAPNKKAARSASARSKGDR